MLRIESRSRPRHGETANGDAAVVVREGEVTLFAVVDGLGHGEGAQVAAVAAADAMRNAELPLEVESLMAALDQALAGTRGAAALVCRARGDRFEACSVGNVALRSAGVDVPLMLSPGILGRRVRMFRVFAAQLRPGCRLLLHSDGISRLATLGEVAKLDLAAASDRLIERHRDPADDATVLLAEFEQGS